MIQEHESIAYRKVGWPDLVHRSGNSHNTQRKGRRIPRARFGLRIKQQARTLGDKAANRQAAGFSLADSVATGKRIQKAVPFPTVLSTRILP